MSTTAPEKPAYTRKDFVSDQAVRWCPGCGDYAILAQIQNVLPTLGVRKENVVFVSGIGCSSRFPYYMDTYGFHGIHGRAPAIATGVRLVNPDLDIWVITGDGDALSIGMGHFVHAIRRNLNMKVILFNNRIYGLTKGQYSPTTPVGHKTKSSPLGALDYPIHPIEVAIGAEATFVARVLDADGATMRKVFSEAAAHRGTAFIEVYQNCIIFNDGAHGHVSDKKQRPEHALYLEEGKPLRFGPNKEHGIKMDKTRPVIVWNAENDDELLVHEPQTASATYAYFLSRLHYPEFPIPFGVFRKVEHPPYDALLRERVSQARERNKGGLAELFRGPHSWTVE
ncbi:MAG: 2-oxoacid:ferredoxin oxidoreductase subunit beta [Candidatus Hydrogenedentota bacterium]|nr:MAG: 2-oxoacid:ferredoxin oxidoreductase subunit beta [Candidatus Hydrogenedentota bacterium]